MIRTFTALFLTLVMVGCGDSPRTPTPSVSHEAGAFRDVSTERHVNFHHRSGASGKFLLPEIMGGGGGFLDVNRDGLLDVLCLSSAPSSDGWVPHRLFIQMAGGLFREAPEDALPRARLYAMGLAAGDIDNDGDEDLCITGVGSSLLWKNRNDGSFEDVTAVAGISGNAWGTSAAFADLDRDGDLDLVICDYVAWRESPEFLEKACFSATGQRDYCSPQSYGAPGLTRVFRNDGTGSFSDATAQLGLDRKRGTALGVVLADFDRDGLLDIYVANDQMPSHLWRQRKDGTFVEEGMERGCAVGETGMSQAGMGVDSVDVDGDESPDLWKVHLHRETHILYLNKGTHFLESTSRFGLSSLTRSHTGFGTAFVDVDRDGLQDIVVANGRVAHVPELVTGPDIYAEPNQWLRQTRAGWFEDASHLAGPPFQTSESSRGLATGDFDNDGATDLLIVNLDGPARLLRNTLVENRVWIGISVLERTGRAALGAEVTVHTEKGRIVRDVRAAKSYLSTSDPRIVIPVAGWTRCLSVDVKWPDGQRESFPPPEFNRYHIFRRR